MRFLRQFESGTQLFFKPRPGFELKKTGADSAKNMKTKDSYVSGSPEILNFFKSLVQKNIDYEKNLKKTFNFKM